MNAQAKLPPSDPSNHLTFPAPSGMSSAKGPVHDSGKLPQLQPTPVSKNPTQSLSHDAARVAIENTPLPGNIWKPGANPAGVQSLVASGLVSTPASVVELARGLKNNVDLIYEVSVRSIFKLSDIADDSPANQEDIKCKREASFRFAAKHRRSAGKETKLKRPSGEFSSTAGDQAV